MAFEFFTLPLAMAGMSLAAGSADQVRKYTLPPAADGKPARILESAEVPANASTLYLSGQVASPIDPTKRPTSIADLGNTETQARNIFAKIEKILHKRGYEMKDVVKVTLFLTPDPQLGGMDFAGANAAFDAYFNVPANPTTVARTTLEVSAFAGPHYLVEIDIIAAKAR